MRECNKSGDFSWILPAYSVVFKLSLLSDNKSLLHVLKSFSTGILCSIRYCGTKLKCANETGKNKLFQRNPFSNKRLSVQRKGSLPLNVPLVRIHGFENSEDAYVL